MKTYGDKNLTYTTKSCPVIINWIEPGSRVLEFGPAFGYITRYLKENLQCNVVGIELNPEMAAEASKYAEKIIVANLDTDSWENEIDGKFDYILFMDVLEHLRDPLSVLKKAITFGDCILTSIPNIGHSSIILSLLEGEFEYKKLGLLDNTHIHFFTRKSIENMMHELQFYSSEEQSNILLYPSVSEFHKYYIKHLWCALSIIRKPDTSIYQFINKWERTDKKTISKTQSKKISFLLSIKIILIDLGCYLFAKPHSQNNFIRKIGLKIK